MPTLIGVFVETNREEKSLYCDLLACSLARSRLYVLVCSIASLLVAQVVSVVLECFRLPDQSHLPYTLREQAEAVRSFGILRGTTSQPPLAHYKSFSSLSSTLNFPAPLIALNSDCRRSSRSLASPPRQSN